MRPGYQPTPVEIIVADQPPIAEPVEAPAAGPPMPDPASVMAAADTPMAPAQAQMGEALLMGEAALDNSLLGRMQRVELALLRLEADFQAIRPSIERLVAVEADLDELVDQLFMLVAQGQGAVAPPAAVAPRGSRRGTRSAAGCRSTGTVGSGWRRAVFPNSRQRLLGGWLPMRHPLWPPPPP